MKNKPENPTRKERVKGKQKERGERKEEKGKKSSGFTPSFYVDFHGKKKTV